METILTANRLYARRGDDELFSSVADLVTAAKHDKQLSGERTYNWKDLKFSADADTVQLQSGAGIADLTHWSFGQACRTLESPAAYMRDQLTPELAADCLNYRISQTEPGTDAVCLVRRPNGSPHATVRAVTSKTYGRLWDADLYDAAENSVFQSRTSNGRWQNAPTWEGEQIAGGRSDRDSWILRIDGGSIVNDPSARGGDGQMYRAILIGNSEVGAGSAWIDCILYRYICGNWMLWGAMVDRQFRRRHVGNNVLRDTVRELATIAYRWNTRSAQDDERIIKSLIDHEIATTQAGVIDELRKVGFTKEQAEDAYARCERSERASPRSFWGIVQGATRASQDSKHFDERNALDTLAAKVLERGRKLVAA